MPYNREKVPCPRGCGMESYAGPMGKHVKTCLMPFTLERIYEIGSVDTTVDGCWEWESLEGGDYVWYPRIARKKVSQMVCELAHGPPAHPGLRPLHSCDNMLCIRPDHLRWGTQAENVQDTYDHGRRKKQKEKV